MYKVCMFLAFSRSNILMPLLCSVNGLRGSQIAEEAFGIETD